LLWEAHMKINKVTFEEDKLTLFRTKKISYKTPKLLSTELEDAFDEIELLGYPLCNPFDLLAVSFSNLFRARHLPTLIGKVVEIVGYLITSRKVMTSNGKLMYFGNFIDYDGFFVDTVHFPPVAKKYPFRGNGVYAITGKVVEEFNCISIEANRLERLAILEDPRYSDTQKGRKIKQQRIV